jgi:hypothetical protein
MFRLCKILHDWTIYVYWEEYGKDNCLFYSFTVYTRTEIADYNLARVTNSVTVFYQCIESMNIESTIFNLCSDILRFTKQTNSVAFSPKKLYRLSGRRWSGNFSVNFCGQTSVTWSARRSLTVVNLGLIARSRYSFK